MDQLPRILFVCTGNICRSPAAEIIWNHSLKEQTIDPKNYADSAGTIAYHTGEPADYRMQKALQRRRYTGQTSARQVTKADGEKFDLLIGMDQTHIDYLNRLIPEYLSKIHLFSEIGELDDIRDIPDPYYGGEQGFERVIDHLEKGCRTIAQRYGFL